METKEFKIQAPDGYEIDKENSTLECIRFKPIKKDITYKDVCDIMFKRKTNYYIHDSGKILYSKMSDSAYDENNATNQKQLERLLALNQLLNIAEYYNKQHPEQNDGQICITFQNEEGYKSWRYDLDCELFGVVALFNKEEDALAVIDNPNFREILDTIYKD